MSRFVIGFREHPEGLVFYDGVQRRYMGLHARYLGLREDPGAMDWALRFAGAFEESSEVLLGWLSERRITYPHSLWLFLPGWTAIMKHLWNTHLPLSVENVAEWLRDHGDAWLRGCDGPE